MLLLFCLVACEKSVDKSTLFSSIDYNETGLDFINRVEESIDYNILEYLYFYNGGGVAMGDINNDGLLDIYFSANQRSNKLYLNLGEWKFKDITAEAGVEAQGNWKTGVSFADINSDGFLDIFVCGVGDYKKFNGFNQVFINRGNSTFEESSEELGLQFKGLSTHIAFLDYDQDGDLDIYLLNHSVHSVRSYGDVSHRRDSSRSAGDRLYENQLIPSGKTYFKDVTKQSGIFNSSLGYGLGVGISDINKDGWPDIYVSNDFHENDYLYLNNKDKTFRQVAEKSLGHTSRFSMGNDIADVNNDGYPDIMTLDMLPQDEAIIKTTAGEDNYEIFKYKLSYKFNPQVTRNGLQISQYVTDSCVMFSDVAMAAGVGATDWSWAPLIADYDQDGLKDIFITNGIWRRPNDLDYINYISDHEKQRNLDSLDEHDLRVLDMMPKGQVPNYLYKNMGNLQFQDYSTKLNVNQPSLSSGAAYGDLDNDGDLDLVINVLNEHPLIYKNNSLSKTGGSHKIKLIGPNGNSYGLGSKVMAYSGGNFTFQEAYYSRGFSSSVEPVLFVSANGPIDSLQVIWPDLKFESIKSPKEKNLVFDYRNAKYSFRKKEGAKSLLTPIPVNHVPQFIHRENDFNAFSRETLIPKGFTNMGPVMAVADVNRDGLDDVFVGGNSEKRSELFIQLKSGWQSSQNSSFMPQSEITGAAFLDADDDSDLDLVTVSGGHESFEAQALSPKLYINDGLGNFTFRGGAFEGTLLNASCIRPYDYDLDGDQDLFIGANVMPGLYGMSPMSFLLINSGTGYFNQKQNWLGSSEFDNPTRVRPGMVTDAVWSEVNNDGLIDLILVGEWMPITILIQQQDHTFKNMTSNYQLSSTRGWWNAIHAADFDKDGDLDWMVGNLGLSSRLRASVVKPLTLYLGDFDSNGGSDHILVYYNGEKSYPFTSRDQLVKQIPSFKKKFLHYRDYRDVRLEDIITPLQQGNSAVMYADILESVFVENKGKDLVVSPLPIEAQLSPVFAFYADDYNQDGHLDVLLGGNLSEVQPELGPFDASYGLVMIGDGKNRWTSLTNRTSGLLVKGEVRSIQKVNYANGEAGFLFGVNNKSIVGFKLK